MQQRRSGPEYLILWIALFIIISWAVPYLARLVISPYSLVTYFAGVAVSKGLIYLLLHKKGFTASNMIILTDLAVSVLIYIVTFSLEAIFSHMPGFSLASIRFVADKSVVAIGLVIVFRYLPR